MIPALKVGKPHTAKTIKRPASYLCDFIQETFPGTWRGKFRRPDTGPYFPTEQSDKNSFHGALRLLSIPLPPFDSISR